MNNTAESWNLIEIAPSTRAEVDQLLGGARPRLLIARHYFPGAPNHTLLASGSREAMFAARRLMDVVL